MADAICYNCKHFKGTAGGYGHCDVYYDTTVHWQGKVCCYFKQEYDNLKDAKDSVKLHMVRIANIRDANGLPYGTLVALGYSVYLVGKNNELIPVLTEEDT